MIDNSSQDTEAIMQSCVTVNVFDDLPCVQR